MLCSTKLFLPVYAGVLFLEFSCLPGLQTLKESQGRLPSASAWEWEGGVGSRGHTGKGLPPVEDLGGQREDQEVGSGKCWGEVTDLPAGLPESHIQPSLLWEGRVHRLVWGGPVMAWDAEGIGGGGEVGLAPFSLQGR